MDMIASQRPTALVLAAALAACTPPAEQREVEPQAKAAKPQPAKAADDSTLRIVGPDGAEVDVSDEPEAAAAVREEIERQEMERREAGEGTGGDWGD